MSSASEAAVKKQRDHIVYGQSYMNSVAMQMLGRQNIYAELFRQMAEKGDFPVKPKDPLTIVEHTIGTGDSSAMLVKNLRPLHPEGDIDYYALDHNNIFIGQACERVMRAGADHVNIHAGDALTDSAESMQAAMGLTEGKKANILLVEHGFYYVAESQEQLDASIKNILPSLAPNSVFISAVSGSRSDIGKLRLTYNPDVNEGKVYEMIDTSLKSQGLEPHLITVPALFPFPKLTPKEWGDLANGVYTFDNCPANNERLFHAINLITFFGRPTEFMHEDGTLKPYVERIRTIVENNPEHSVISDVNLQIAASPNSSATFKQHLAETVENINQHIDQFAEPSLAGALDRFRRERIDVEKQKGR